VGRASVPVAEIEKKKEKGKKGTIMEPHLQWPPAQGKEEAVQ